MSRQHSWHAHLRRFALTSLLLLGVATSAFAQFDRGTITGTVTASSNGEPLGGLTLRAYTSSGILAASASSLASGGYSITGLSGGTYFVRTENTIGLIDDPGCNGATA